MTNPRRRRWIAGILALLCGGAAPGGAPAIATSADLATIRPSNRFVCGETVYVIVQWKTPPSATDQLTATWIDAAGRIARTNSVPVSPGDRNTYVYWRTPRPGRWEGLSGSDAVEAGHWTVRLRLDGEPVGETRFDLSC